MKQWVVTMQNFEGLFFKDYFEGETFEDVKLSAERFFVNATFIDAELIS